MSLRNLRPYTQASKRPRVTPEGTPPLPTRRSTRSRTVIEGHRLMDNADQRRIRRHNDEMARLADALQDGE